MAGYCLQIILFLSTLSLRRATFSSPNTSIIILDISIHALLAESDHIRSTSGGHPGISIHALLAESDSKLAKTSWTEKISIHALLAESDKDRPRPSTGIYNFYPRSPCGERLEKVPADVYHQAFLSTLSLRRAT